MFEDGRDVKHLALNAWDVTRFIDLVKEQFVGGYDILRSKQIPRAGRHATLTGILVSLASFDEALAILEAMGIDVGPIRNEFGEDLRTWKSLRHDAAHVFDRVFKEKKNANIPWVQNGLVVTGYDEITDTVRTGNDPQASVRLWCAIERAFEMSRRIDLAVAGPDDTPDDVRVASVTHQIFVIREKFANEAAHLQ